MRFKRKREHGSCVVVKCKEPSVAYADSSTFFSKRGGEVELCEDHFMEANEMADARKTPLQWRALDTPSDAVPMPSETLVQAVAAAPVEVVETQTALTHETQKEAEAAKGMLESCRALPVESSEDVDFVAQVLADVKGESKRLDARRKEITQPLNEALKATRALFKPAIDYLGQCEATLKGKLSAAHAAAEAVKRAALAEAHAQATQENAEGAEHALQRIEEAQDLVQAEGIQYRTVWRFEVVDQTAIPREFCMPDLKLIGDLVKHRKGNAGIPGIRVWEETTVASKSS